MEQNNLSIAGMQESPTPRQVTLEISGALHEAEWKVLRQFCDKAHRLMGTKLAAAGLGGIKARMLWERGRGVKYETTLPPEEQVAELLMAFRFFYLQREPSNFLAVMSILSRHSRHEEVRQLLKQYRKGWGNCLFGNTLELVMGEKQITSSLLIDLWLNAHYFHSDEAKAVELDQISEGLSDDFAKYMLLDSVFEASRMVIKIHRAVCLMTGSRFNTHCPYIKGEAD